MKSNFKVNDTGYYIDVTDCLVVTASEVLIQSIREEKGKKPYYNLKVLKNIVYRDYEIPLSKQQKEEEKNNEFFSLCDPRKPSLISSCSGYSKVYKRLTVENIEKAVEKHKKILHKEEKHRLKVERKFRCPITGGKMVRQYERHVIMDGPIIYTVESYPEMRWEKWPRGNSNAFYQPGAKGRIFEINWQTYKWNELIELGSKLVDIPKTKKQWDEYYAQVKQLEEDEKKRREQYEADVKSGKIKKFLPPLKKVGMKMEKVEFINVALMCPPSGNIYFLELLENGKKLVGPEMIESSISALK